MGLAHGCLACGSNEHSGAVEPKDWDVGRMDGMLGEGREIAPWSFIGLSFASREENLECRYALGSG
jgi:hypothetical protein